MQINKILFLGLGGAGQRHLRIFRSLLDESVEFSAKSLKYSLSNYLKYIKLNEKFLCKY